MRILATLLIVTNILNVDETKMFTVSWAGKSFKIYKNLDVDASQNITQDSEIGWCNPDNFQLSDANSASSDEEAQAAEQVGAIQNIFKSQINVYTPVNILTLGSLATESDTIVADLQEYYTASPPFLLGVGVLGLILTFFCYCYFCCASCCCGVDPEDFEKQALCRLVFFIITLSIVVLTLGLSFFAFRGGPKAVRGFMNVACTTQSFIQPMIVLGQNESETALSLANSSQCFQIMKDSQQMEKSKWFQRGSNPKAAIEVESNCIAIRNLAAQEIDMDLLIDADPTLTNDLEPEKVTNTRIIFEDYDFNNTYSDTIEGNEKQSYFVGLAALGPHITTLMDNLSPSSSDSIAASFQNITNIWTGIDSTFQDSLDNIINWVAKPITLYLSSSANVASAMAETSGESSSMPQAPVFFDEDAAAGATSPLGTLFPMANFNWQVMAPSLATNETETGAKQILQPEAIVDLGQPISPVDKTITNCISGPLLIAPLADTMYNTFSAIDLAVMLGDLDPQAMIDEQILGPLGELYTSIQEAHALLPEQSQLSLIPIGINALALVLMLLTAAGLILGFLQCTECAKCLMNCSWCCSFGLLSVSQLMTIIFMILTTVFSQVCWTISGITLAPFAYQAINSDPAIGEMAAMGGTCLWGDGQIIAAFLPSEILDQLDSAFTKVPPSFIKTVGNSGANLEDDNTPMNASNFCGYPMLFKDLTQTTSYYDSLSQTQANETSNITINLSSGSTTLTQQELSWTNIHDANQAAFKNAKFASYFNASGDFTIAQDLSALTPLDNYVNGSDLVRVECAESGGNIVFVISEDCASTDSGATAKAINLFAADVASDVAALTLDNTVQLCQDFQTFDDANLQSSSQTLNQPLHADIETYQGSDSSTGIPSHLLFGEANREAALDFFANTCENVSSYSGIQADILANGTQAHKVLANKFAMLNHLFITRIQSRLYQIMYQQTYQNENDGSDFLAPNSASVQEQLDYPTTGNTYTMLSSSRSDLRAQAFDTFQEVLVVLPKFTDVFDAFTALKDGVNCSVILKKGLGSVLSSICAFDPSNPSLLSSLLEISFYQMIITILCTFGVCCGFCWKRYSLDAYKPQEEDVTDK